MQILIFQQYFYLMNFNFTFFTFVNICLLCFETMHSRWQKLGVNPTVKQININSNRWWYHDKLLKEHPQKAQLFTSMGWGSTLSETERGSGTFSKTAVGKSNNYILFYLHSIEYSSFFEHALSCTCRLLTALLQRRLSWKLQQDIRLVGVLSGAI